MKIQRALLRTGNRNGPTTRHRSEAVQENVDKIVDWPLRIIDIRSEKGASIVMLALLGNLRVSEFIHYDLLAFSSRAMICGG